MLGIMSKSLRVHQRCVTRAQLSLLTLEPSPSTYGLSPCVAIIQLKINIRFITPRLNQTRHYGSYPKLYIIIKIF